MEEKITKFLLGTITDSELDELKDWMKDPANQALVQQRLLEHNDVNLASLEDEVEQAFQKTLTKIQEPKKPVARKITPWLRYSAAAVLLIGFFFTVKQYIGAEDELAALPADAITLDMGDGRVQIIHSGESKVLTDNAGGLILKQEGDGLDYSEAHAGKELVYNKLNIPNGKTFQITLSDGSKVNMNAGSSLRYPIDFSSAETREVFLTGEAYFSVAKDKTKPFLVNVNGLQVEVYGTAFNVSSYEEDQDIEVVLVEGAVGLHREHAKEEQAVQLLPGQRGTFEINGKEIQVDKVNTGLYTAWLDGGLVFRDQSFNQILTKLERHFNVKIENRDEQLGKELFNASFGKVGIAEVLEFFNEVHAIDYTIKNDKIIIN